MDVSVPGSLLRMLTPESDRSGFTQTDKRRTDGHDKTLKHAHAICIAASVSI